MVFTLRRLWLTRMRFFVLGWILLSLQWRLWQPEGLFSVNRLQKKVAAQTAALLGDQIRNQGLADQVNWLKHSTAAVEHHARQSLGMVKPGETFYLWIEKE